MQVPAPQRSINGPLVGCVLRAETARCRALVAARDSRATAAAADRGWDEDPAERVVASGAGPGPPPFCRGSKPPADTPARPALGLGAIGIRDIEEVNAAFPNPEQRRAGAERGRRTRLANPWRSNRRRLVLASDRHRSPTLLSQSAESARAVAEPWIFAGVTEAIGGWSERCPRDFTQLAARPREPLPHGSRSEAAHRGGGAQPDRPPAERRLPHVAADRRRARRRLAEPSRSPSTDGTPPIQEPQTLGHVDAAPSANRARA